MVPTVAATGFFSLEWSLILCDAAYVLGICLEVAHAGPEARQIIPQWPQPGG
jgi:hypothetical protein